MQVFRSYQEADGETVTIAEGLRDVYWQLSKADQILIFRMAKQLYEREAIQNKRQDNPPGVDD